MNFIQKLVAKAAQAVNVYTNRIYEPVVFNRLSFYGLELLYDNLADVRIIEDFISDNIAKIPVLVQDKKGNEVKLSPLVSLIEETNPSQTWAEFIKELVILYGLTGNGIVKRDPETGYLFTLPTSKTKVNLMFDKSLPEFRNTIAGYTFQLGGKEYPIPVEDVLHVKNATLAAENGLWALGSSPYYAGTPNVKTLEANYSSRVATIKDRGALGFITNKSKFPDEVESKDVKKKLIEKFGIREGQDKFIITTQDLDYKQMALGMAELQLLENLDVDFSRICQLRQLDPLVFASKNSAYANQKQARAAAIKNVVIPVASKIYDKLNEFLRVYYGGVRIVPQYNELPEYGEINTELSKKVINEVKAKIITAEQAFYQLYPDDKFVNPEPTTTAQETQTQTQTTADNGNEN